MSGRTSTEFGTPSSTLATVFPPLFAVVERLLLVLTTRKSHLPPEAAKNGVAVSRASFRSTPNFQLLLPRGQKKNSLVFYRCSTFKFFVEGAGPVFSVS